MKQFFFLTFLLIFWMSTSLADTIQLTGYISDFSKAHPDFEGGISGHKTGCVETILSPFGTPIMVQSNDCNITQLSDWYVGTNPGSLNPGKTALFPITLDNGTNSPGGIYTYENNSFFPIDDSMDGNEGNAHNYHFTFEIHTEFTYNGGETFTFKGDDDVWVFINNELVVDLGGVHGSVTGSVDLDTLNLNVGDIYNLDLFFAERHTVASSFRIDTTLALTPSTWYADFDGDSYGDPKNSIITDKQPAFAVADNTDCNDADPNINPGAAEINQDGIDQDCDGKDGGVQDTTWYYDADGDGFGDPQLAKDSPDKPAGYAADGTDCDDSDATINPNAVEIIGDGIDQNCNGNDGNNNQSSKVEQIYLLSPANKQTLSYGGQSTQIVFSFSKITNAAKYILHMEIKDILNNLSIPFPIELIPPGTQGSSTSNFSESSLGMIYKFNLDTDIWDVLAIYDIGWGVEAYDDSGILIGSTYDLSTPDNYVNDLKLIASSSIVMTSPDIESEFNKSSLAPTFQWKTYPGVTSYSLILAHMGSIGFDHIIDESNLISNFFPISDTTWQSMEMGKWYWTILGQDASGNQLPKDFTIFNFEVK